MTFAACMAFQPVLADTEAPVKKITEMLYPTVMIAVDGHFGDRIGEVKRRGVVDTVLDQKGVPGMQTRLIEHRRIDFAFGDGQWLRATMAFTDK